MNFPHVIDNTMRAAFVSCPRKFYNEYVLNLSPTEGGESIHLIAGGAIAKGLEVARKAFYNEGKGETESRAEGLVALIEKYGDAEERLNILAQDPTHNKRFERVVEAYETYLDTWRLPTDHIKPHKTEIGSAVEFSFAIPLEINHPETGEPLLYAGKSDFIGEMNNALWVVDEKTTSQMGSSWATKWGLRSQFTGYCYAARSHNLPVAGAIIRGIAMLKTHIQCREAIVYRPDFLIDRWLLQLEIDISRMIHSYQENYWDYNLADGCESYGGCPFMQLCEKEDDTAWRDNFYKVRWDPIKGERVPVDG